jgi:hypothetical protein
MDKEHMRLHLKTVFNPDNFREFEDGSFEIAYESKRGMGPNAAKRFALDEIDQAVDFAAAKNQSSNIYIVSAVLYGECQGRSNASHFYASKFLVCDVDENWKRTFDAVEALSLNYRLGVLTGSKPEPRVQVWFELDQVTDDIEIIREAAPALNAAICGDANSIDTGTHLFRLAGTDSYPSLSKKAKGYAEEQIELKVHDSPPVNVESLLSLQPHPEYDSKPISKIGKGGKKDGIQRDEDGKVINGREIYWRSIVMAAMASRLEDHGDAPCVNQLFDECFPTFLDNTGGDDRWTSPDGQRALKQRVGNTLKRRANGRLKVAPKAAVETTDSQKYKPFDIWGNFTTPAFPRGLLPPVLDEFAFALGSTMGCDPAGLAMDALTVCASAIPDQLQLKVKRYDHWSEPARLWTVKIGPPSAKKSPIQNAAEKPLKRIDAELYQEYLKELKAWQEQKEEDRDEKPICKRKRVDDATTEAMQNVMHDNPEGLMGSHDELSGLFGRLEKYGGKGSGADRAFWLRCYNGGSYPVDRVGRGSFHIANASLCLIGGIQPDPLRKIADNLPEDGLLQRMTPVFLAPSKVGKDETIPPVSDRYEVLIRDLSRISEKVMDGSRVIFSPDAQEYRAEVEVKNHQLLSVETFNGKLAARFGKYDGLFARLCLTLHCIKNVQKDVLSDVDLDTAKQAARLLFDYILPSDMALYGGVLGVADNHDTLTDIAGFILSKKLDVLTYRDLSRSTRKLKKLDHRDARALFEQLAALGWVRVSEDKNPNKPPSCVVNPQVHVEFAERADQEAARRSETVALMQSLGRAEQ